MGPPDAAPVSLTRGSVPAVEVLGGRDAAERSDLRFVVKDGQRWINEPVVTAFMPFGVLKGRTTRLARSSAEEGSAAHEAVAMALDGAQVTGPDRGYALGAQAFLDHIGASVVDVEAPVFTEGRYGGFVDCVATAPSGKLVAIDWKTGTVSPTTAVQLLAYICAQRRLHRQGQDLYPEGLAWQPAGESTMQCPTDFETCWAVALTPRRWQAVGFGVHSEADPPALGPYQRLFLQDDPVAPMRIGDCWDLRVGPFDTPQAAA